MKAFEIAFLVFVIGGVAMALIGVLHRITVASNEPVGKDGLLNYGKVYNCAKCGLFRHINRFGICANCWSKMDDEQLRRLGIPIEGQARTITIHKPASSRLLTIVVAVLASGVVAAGMVWFSKGN